MCSKPPRSWRAKGPISYQSGPTAQEIWPKISKGLKARPTPTSQVIPRLPPTALGETLPSRRLSSLPGGLDQAYSAPAKLNGRPQDRHPSGTLETAAKSTKARVRCCERWAKPHDSQFRCAGKRTGSLLLSPNSIAAIPFAAHISPMPTVTANGKTVPLTASCSLIDFLATHGFFPKSVVVEHNGDAVAPSEFSSRQVNPGDQLEIVRIVAGG